jgi:hypothetical protein
MSFKEKGKEVIHNISLRSAGSTIALVVLDLESLLLQTFCHVF